MGLIVYIVIALLVGVLAGLKVLAPKTKTTLDDDVVEFLTKYQVPIEEFLGLLAKK